MGSFSCKRCGLQIYVSDENMSPGGKRIPMDANTNEPHQCEGSGVVATSKNDFEMARALERIKKLEEQVAKLEILIGESSPMSRIMALERKLAVLELG